MKLLFDQNLSARLVNRLADLFPDSSHVAMVGLEYASDEIVWDYAKLNHFIIVTKDADFNDLSLLRGTPPKIIWLRLGNCTTNQIEASLRRHQTEIESFATDPMLGVFTIF
jgi:predicted nuclease of predicted toxin-antitoxin system